MFPIIEATLSLSESVADAHGVRRELWYRYVNTEGFATLRENPIFEQPSDGYTTTFNMSATFEVSENYGERLTSYLQVELLFLSLFHTKPTFQSIGVFLISFAMVKTTTRQPIILLSFFLVI